MSKGKLLITGATGYIGSHAAVSSMEAGYSVVGIDNFVNSHESVVQSIISLSDGEFYFVKGDMCDKVFLRSVFEKHPDIMAVLHFAGLKSVSESLSHPLEYYETNVAGTVTLVRVMEEFSCSRIIFSSSATVYGLQVSVPCLEGDETTEIATPYGKSKFLVEGILEDLTKGKFPWKIICLRYFNPVGAHQSGIIGELPVGKPNNLFPVIGEVLAGIRESLSVFGDDYDTVDGTGVRDYIHVQDLVEGHIRALDKLLEIDEPTHFYDVYNLGAGNGYSVLQVLNMFEKVTGVKVPAKIVARRDGDIAECWANPDKAKTYLNWQTKKNLHDMVKDYCFWIDALRNK